MANFTERAVIDPNYLLAQSNSLNRYASEIPFIERTVKEVRSSLSDFRRRHLTRTEQVIGAAKGEPAAKNVFTL